VRTPAHTTLMLLVLTLISMHALVSAATVTVRNDVPRLDQFGHIINAHDGSVFWFEDTYFMYGTVYENCTQTATQCTPPCGYNPNTFSLYTSADLQSWTLQNTNILPEASLDNHAVNYWMPVVARNPTTGVFLMQFWTSRCGFIKPCADIATSASPYGPFKTQPPLQLTATPSSQMGLFFDDETGCALALHCL
jgi:hypothetical protein